MNRLFVLFFLGIVFLSCNNNTVYTKYKSVNNGKWHKDSLVSFTFKAKDTISKNNIYINLRNNKDYEFSNIFLIIGITFPNNHSIKDTLEYRMTDEKGVFLGTGFTDIKENKLEYKTNIRFPQKGNYTFSVEQAMRKLGKIEADDLLNGITDVGIEIEKQTKNE
jgi:gliding motility-associated lipoprotein GldH